MTLRCPRQPQPSERAKLGVNSVAPSRITNAAGANTPAAFRVTACRVTGASRPLFNIRAVNGIAASYRSGLLPRAPCQKRRILTVCLAVSAR